jgi:membrane associated rhomboid family serine protease
VDCGAETPRDEMYGPPDELRCRDCVQRRFPTTNVPTRHRSTVFRRWPPVTTSLVAGAIVVSLLYWSRVPAAFWLVAAPKFIWDGQLWRLATSVLPHVNILHLVFNLLWLWRLGKATEQWMGSARYGGFVVAAAAGPIAAQVLIGSSGVGLSGVVYALFGLLLALRHDEDFAAELMTAGVVQTFVAWFFICIALTYWDIMPVANTAHGVGALIGWLYGRAALAPWRRLAVTAVSVFCLALVLGTQYMPWDRSFCWFQAVRYLRQGNSQAAEPWLERAQGPETVLERWNHIMSPARNGPGQGK